MLNAEVVAATPPKPKAEIFINFLLEVVINFVILTLVKIFLALDLDNDKCH